MLSAAYAFIIQFVCFRWGW